MLVKKIDTRSQNIQQKSITARIALKTMKGHLEDVIQEKDMISQKKKKKKPYISVFIRGPSQFILSVTIFSHNYCQLRREI